MELNCSTRILNSTNSVETTPIPMVITEEDMSHASITELERQARSAWISEQLSALECDFDILGANHYRLCFTAEEYRHLAHSAKVFIADCNRLPWLKVEIIVAKAERDHPKFKRSLRTEEED